MKLTMLVYIGITVILALLVTKQNKTAKDMFVAKGGLGLSVIIVLILSETIGGTGTVGDAAESMSSIGMAAMWSTTGLALGCFLYVFIFGKYFRILGATRNVMSVPAGYEVRFDTRTRIVMLIIISLSYTCIFALQPVAATAILSPMFGVERSTMYVIVGLIFILIPCMGGLRGLASMNRVHSFVMFFGLMLVAIFAVRHAGGIEAVKLAAPSEYFNPFSVGIGTVIVWVAGSSLSQMSSALLTADCIGAKSYKQLRIGVVIAAIGIVIISVFPAIIGICAHVMTPDIDPKTALYAVSSLVNPFIGGLATVAVIAAIFSTGPATLLVVGTTIAQDLYKGFMKPEATDKEVLLFSRLAMIIIGVVAVVWGSQTGSMFSELLSILQIRSIAAIVLMFALVWPRVDARAGFWSMLAGGGIAIVWHFMKQPFGIPTLLPSIVVGIVVLVVLTLCSKQKVSDGHQVYLDLQQEYKAAGYNDIVIK